MLERTAPHQVAPYQEHPVTKRKTEPHKKTGRPTTYKPEYAEQAKKICDTIGCIEPEVASYLGVTQQTLTRWKGRYPELRAALKTGKEGPDERVVNSLYHRAIGYSYMDGKKKIQMPPDVTACIFWLKNRRPDLWRDKHDMTVAKAPPDNRSIME